ncbi:hypothetical protein CPB83DRAFT_845932 [Crepidotus variabilis]|uniref:Uncharacterized protein n=1 Tax=Crepidotus variabilis TaxID=179855 RepID=A0A9P6EQM7_9AGAR|nr:hypothetical protein CPB83DRAFT_845932 [Crepidotus variabilis]
MVHRRSRNILTPRNQPDGEEMCNYLDWELTVNNPILSNFKAAVKEDFKETRNSYPNYPTAFVSERTLRSPASSTNIAVADITSSTSPVPAFVEFANTRSQHPPPQKKTPLPSFSTSTSPTLSVLLATPDGPELNVKICGVDYSPTFGITNDILSPAHPLKSRMFAFVVPSEWYHLIYELISCSSLSNYLTAANCSVVPFRQSRQYTCSISCSLLAFTSYCYTYVYFSLSNIVMYSSAIPIFH